MSNSLSARSPRNQSQSIDDRLQSPIAVAMLDEVSGQSSEFSKDSIKETREQCIFINIRLPKSLHKKLKTIKENTPHSINSFMVEAVSTMVDLELAKIAKRKEMGL